MLDSVEGLGAVHEHPIDLATLPDVHVNGLIGHPGTEGCTAILLKPKLEIVTFQQMTIIVDYDPI